jgi:hypothetical protein
MKKLSILVAVFAGIIATETARADAIPYGSPGVPLSTTYNFTAAVTGTEYLTVYGTTAADFPDALSVSVGNGPYVYTGIHNASFGGPSGDPTGKTPIGFTYSFFATAGQSITLQLATNPADGNANIYYSNATGSDGFSHVYSTLFSGGALPQDPSVTVGAGTYIGFEDQNLNPLPSNPGSEVNYTDIQVILTTVAPVPELSTWAMMVVGFAGLGFFGYRRSRNSSMAMASA